MFVVYVNYISTAYTFRRTLESLFLNSALTMMYTKILIYKFKVVIQQGDKAVRQQFEFDFY